MALFAWEVSETKIEKHMGHRLEVAKKFYVSPEIFDWNDRRAFREIIGDLYRK